MRVNPQLNYKRQCKEFEQKLLNLREELPLRESPLEETKQTRSLLSSPRAHQGHQLSAFGQDDQQSAISD